MPDLIDFFDAAGDQQPTEITEMRLGKEPGMALFFTSECTEAKLHYEGDESVLSYVNCPGGRCPYCHIGSSPKAVLLMPVFNVEAQEVQVLRISSNRGPGSLGTSLLPHLKDPDIADKALLISRDRARYRVQALPLSEDADRGEAAIKAFLDTSPDLAAAFPAMTPEEMAEIPRVALKLRAIGGLPTAAPEEQGGV